MPFEASDPDGDPLTALAMSDNPGAANAYIAQPGVVQVVANSPGSASITVTVEDGRGGSTSTAFVVTVVQPNNDPTINSVPPVELAPGEVRDVFFEASDPDGDPLTALAMSDNPGVANASVSQPGVLQIVANSPARPTSLSPSRMAAAVWRAPRLSSPSSSPTATQPSTRFRRLSWRRASCATCPSRQPIPTATR